jgi:hypothetical protein
MYPKYNVYSFLIDYISFTCNAPPNSRGILYVSYLTHLLEDNETAFYQTVNVLFACKDSKFLLAVKKFLTDENIYNKVFDCIKNTFTTSPVFIENFKGFPFLILSPESLNELYEIDRCSFLPQYERHVILGGMKRDTKYLDFESDTDKKQFKLIDHNEYLLSNEDESSIHESNSNSENEDDNITLYN